MGVKAGRHDASLSQIRAGGDYEAGLHEDARMTDLDEVFYTPPVFIYL